MTNEEWIDRDLRLARESKLSDDEVCRIAREVQAKGLELSDEVFCQMWSLLWTIAYERSPGPLTERLSAIMGAEDANN